MLYAPFGNVRSLGDRLYSAATINAAVDATQQDFGERLCIELVTRVRSGINNITNAVLPSQIVV
jgi:hypothetical protein